MTREFAISSSFKTPKNIFIGEKTKILSYACIEASSGSVNIGKNSYIDRNTIISTKGGHINIGEHCSFNPYCVIYGHGGLEIGNDVRIATGAVIIPANHGFDDIDVNICEQKGTVKGIKIGNNCWLGAGVKILDGVKIGEGSVVGAGSVVTKSFDKNSVIAGVPAKLIKKRGL